MEVEVVAEAEADLEVAAVELGAPGGMKAVPVVVAMVVVMLAVVATASAATAMVAMVTAGYKTSTPGICNAGSCLPCCFRTREGMLQRCNRVGTDLCMALDFATCGRP